MMRVAWAMPICRFMSRERINDLDSEKDVAVGGDALGIALEGQCQRVVCWTGSRRRKG